MDAHLERATLLTYDGWGHGVYDRNRCTRDAAHAYLIDGAMPPEGAHCPAVQPEPVQTAVRPVAPW